jgi:hypothetical protein
LWGDSPVATRWDHFRKNVNGIGPAMMSELLCHCHPKQCGLWNRVVVPALTNLKVANLPKHDYQLNGKFYEHLSRILIQVSSELDRRGLPDPDLLHVDYFIWKELRKQESVVVEETEAAANLGVSPPEFIHNDIRDKITSIGQFLGF